MKAQFNIKSPDAASLVEDCYATARSFFGDEAVIVMLLQVAYAQETIVVTDPEAPVVVDWAATVIVEEWTMDAPPAQGWVLVP